MNSITIIGNLGGDPELKYTQSGAAVCSLSVATTHRFKDKETTSWHKVIVWQKLAENCAKYLSKGRQVAVRGRMEYRQWEDKNGTKHRSAEIVAEEVQFLGGGQQQQRDDTSGKKSQRFGAHDMEPSGDAFEGGGSYDPDSIPF